VARRVVTDLIIYGTFRPRRRRTRQVEVVLVVVGLTVSIYTRVLCSVCVPGIASNRRALCSRARVFMACIQSAK